MMGQKGLGRWCRRKYCKENTDAGHKNGMESGPIPGNYIHWDCRGTTAALITLNQGKEIVVKEEVAMWFRDFTCRIVMRCFLIGYHVLLVILGKETNSHGLSPLFSVLCVVCCDVLNKVMGLMTVSCHGKKDLSGLKRCDRFLCTTY